MSFTNRSSLLLSNMYLSQWHLHGRTMGNSDNKYSSIDVENAWEKLNSYGSQDVVIGFADDGCLMSSVDDDISSKFIAGAYLENGILYAGLPSAIQDKMFIPNFKHGSALAGLMAAPLTNDLPIGVAPGCCLLPVRWEFDKGFKISQRGFNQILRFISDKVDVFLNTWARLPHMNFSEDNLQLIKELSVSGGRRGKGIVFVWAAGNSNCPIHYESAQAIPYSGHVNSDGKLCDGKFSSSFTHDLTQLNNVLLVSAVNCHGQKAHYSCYGPGISLCAPSNNRHSFGAYPFTEPGLTTRSADAQNFTHNFKGTSGSAALVAAVASLVISGNDSLNAIDIVSILEKTASKDVNFSRYPESNFCCDDLLAGKVIDTPISPFNHGQFNDEGWSPWFGNGVVNAGRAVGLAFKQV